MKKLLKYAGLLILPVAAFVSCDEESYPDTTQYLTQITSIKIVNGGLSGTEVIEGTVNENKKTIAFPEVHMDSDLSKVKFEITATDERAHLDSLEYNFVVAEGYSERTRTIKIENSTRFREYYVTIKLDVPVWGGDFTKVKVYDFSPTVFKEGDYAAGSVDMPTYDANAGGGKGRQFGISLKNVLIVDRTADGPGLVPLADIKQGKLDGFKSLTGFEASWGSGGGVIKHGHVYISNGTPWNTGGYFLNHWDEDHPEVAPTKLLSSVAHFGRYDGVLSGDIDANGNGYFFLTGNSSNVPIEQLIMRHQVSNFTTMDKTEFLAGETPRQGSWATFNKVPGTGDEYLYSGINNNNAPVRLANSSGVSSYSLPLDVFPPQTAGASVISFNSERYLMVLNLSGLLSIYDMTIGATTQEALEKMDTVRPLFIYSVGAGNNANASVTTDWVADGDDTLYIVAGAAGGGFAVFEVPKKVKE